MPGHICRCGNCQERGEALLRAVNTAIEGLVSDTKRQAQIAKNAGTKIAANAQSAITLTEFRDAIREELARLPATEVADDDPIRPGALH